jgi:hypothetical protein
MLQAFIEVNRDEIIIKGIMPFTNHSHGRKTLACSF